MPRIVVDLSDEEYEKFIAKAGNQTYREFVMNSLNIPFEVRKMGRPSEDDLKDMLVKKEAERVRKFYEWELREKIEADKPKVAEAVKKLGLDGVKGDLPALGIKRKYEDEG